MNDIDHDLVIVGAGAAGLWAAGAAARRALALNTRLRLAVIDGREQVGAKILMSGGTRCNLTHHEVRAEDFRGGNANRVRRVLKAHSPAASLARFTDELGVPVKIEPEFGKVFPADDSAQTVLDALLSDLERHGTPLLTRNRCVSIEPVPVAAGTLWRLGLGDDVSPLLARRVLLCTGGQSYPKTGSDGAMWKLLAELGHTIVTPVPALTPFVLGTGFHRTLTGVSCPVELTLRAGERVEARVRGPMLFTHVGVSGPAVLDLSGYWTRARADRPEVPLQVHASFLPSDSPETARARWIELARKSPTASARRALDVLPRRLAEVLLRHAGCDPAMPIAQVDRSTRGRALDAVLSFELPVSGVRGFTQAEVTSGGVPLEEVDHGLESRKLPAVHLAGEALHVDGRLGGFNFQWAWSSATVAAEAAVERLGR